MKRHITLLIGLMLASTGVGAQGLFIPSEDGWNDPAVRARVAVALEDVLRSSKAAIGDVPEQLPTQTTSEWNALQTLKQGQRVEVTIQLPSNTSILISDFCKNWESLSITTGTHQVQFRSVSDTALRVDYSSDCPNAEYSRDWVKAVVLLTNDRDRVTVYAVPPTTVADIELWNLMLQQAMHEHTREGYTYILLDRTVPSSQIKSHVTEQTAASAQFAAFLKRNEMAAQVAGVQLPPNVQLIDTDKVLRPRSAGQFWYDDFPRTVLVQLSLPIVSEDGKRALTYWWTSGGFDDGRGTCYEWERRSGGWEMVGSLCGWIN